MITLQKLILVAPFSEEVKTELLSQVDTFTDAKKFELIDMCWVLISQWYQNEIRARYEIAMREMAEGKKSYTKEELAKIPDQLFDALVNKLQAASTVEDIQEVREKLADITHKQ